METPKIKKYKTIIPDRGWMEPNNKESVSLSKEEIHDRVQAKALSLGWVWKPRYDPESVTHSFLYLNSNGELASGNGEIFYKQSNNEAIEWQEILKLTPESIILKDQSENSASTKKPPLGLTPSDVFQLEVKVLKQKAKKQVEDMRPKRAQEIVQAMKRYAEAKEPIPFEWVDELHDLFFMPDWLNELMDFA